MFLILSKCGELTAFLYLQDYNPRHIIKKPTNIFTSFVISGFVGNLLSGLTIAVLIIIIICLSISLHMARNNKSIFGVNLNKQPAYLRQESGMGVTLCNITSTNNISNMNEKGRDDGSTLTVNSGMVQISGLTEPETPTPMDENKMTFTIKKPKAPIQPEFQKAQMDQIIKGVLNRQQKSDSATFRELDLLTKPKILKTYDDEFSVRRNSASLNQLDALANEEADEDLYANKQAIQEMKSKLPTTTMNRSKESLNKGNIANLKQSKSYDSLQPKYPVEEDEQEVYDTVPNPVRCTSDAESDGYVDQLHVYDLPPRRNEKNHSRNVVMDQDSQYLLPLTKKQLVDKEKTYYVNANQFL